MKFDKQDRNIAVTVTVVLAVCTVTLVIILSSIWQLIRPGFELATEILGMKVKTTAVNYNFHVPEIQLEDNTDSSESLAQLDYNFTVPKLQPVEEDTSLFGFEDAILNDARLAGYGSGKETPQINLNIMIPKINVDSPVIQGLGGEDMLQYGFWVYPTSKAIGEGEVVLLCHRRYFGSRDPRSCWHLDKVAPGDEIILGNEANSIKYKVVGTNVFEGGDPIIYQTSDSEDYLKIVTCTPLGSDTHRLVVLAKRVVN